MPDIGNIGYSSGSSGAGPISRSSVDMTARARQITSNPSSSTPERSDRVELSEHAKWLDALRKLPPIRAEKVANVKAAIEAGTYETEEKLNVAIDRLLADLGEDVGGDATGSTADS